MSESPAGSIDRHLTAVNRSLTWAQDSADRGDYADALGWMGVLEAIGEELSPAQQAKRLAWSGALAVAPRTVEVL